MRARSCWSLAVICTITSDDSFQLLLGVHARAQLSSTIYGIAKRNDPLVLGIPRGMNQTFAILLLSTTAFAQHLSIGIKGGVPFTGAFSDFTQNSVDVVTRTFS